MGMIVGDDSWLFSYVGFNRTLEPILDHKYLRTSDREAPRDAPQYRKNFGYPCG